MDEKYLFEEFKQPEHEIEKHFLPFMQVDIHKHTIYCIFITVTIILITSFIIMNFHYTEIIKRLNKQCAVYEKTFDDYRPLSSTLLIINSNLSVALGRR